MLRCATSLFLTAAAVDAGSPWPASARANASLLVSRMALSDLINLTAALQMSPYQGTIPAQPQNGLPHIGNHDGPQGVAGGFTRVTAFPSAFSIACTWDPALAFAFGAANGLEHRIKGANVVLAPGVNIARVPMCGRLFEYLGEDPVLAGAIASQIVLGIQSNNISACLKHFILNVQETERHNVSSNVDRRTFMELYAPPFEAVVDAGVGSVMCSYNRINGSTWACEDASMQEDLLRGRWGFQGFVRSDGHALWHTEAPALHGCDQEQPNTEYFGPALAAAVAKGTVPLARVQEMVTRQLTAYFALNVVSDPLPITPTAVATSAERAALARALGAEGTVLLKNKGGLLPLNASALRRIAVFGDQATTEGGGSGHVISDYTITPFQGILEAVGGAPPAPRPNGSCAYLQDHDYDQPSSPCVDAATKEDCCNLCSSLLQSCAAFNFRAGDSCPGASPPTANRCWLNPATTGLRPLQGCWAGACPPAPSPAPGATTVVYGGSDPSTVGELARSADVAVVVVATTSAEGSDRPTLNVDPPFDSLVAAVAAVQPNTVVVVRCPGPCLMPWLDDVPAVFYQGLAGQEAGRALADVLFGKVNPSAKLALSFPSSMECTWLSPLGCGAVNEEQFPGTARGGPFPETDFSEKLEVGYRFYDAHPEQPSPLFPFGMGLSYTTFSYAGLTVDASTPAPAASANVSLTVTNSGALAGKEVVQLYVAYPAALGEPPQLLRAFHKTAVLAPGDSEVVRLFVGTRGFSIFDVARDDWVAQPGSYGLRVGGGSRDIRLTAHVQL